ncbi:MAG: 2-succinyl-5-enolpyruvyl-6-hydroxy-3-cyclohexene-1-carboxylic-acid synthase [Candidatus Zixiibacteriota bacterium]
MTTCYPSLNALWTDLIVEELVRCGVSHFFMTPGSRSSPLVVAAARNKRVHSLIHFDERGAAYCALGYSRAAGSPAAVICTSGTAVANLVSAVVEASMDTVPLILLTADRPPELRATGANQTIDQVKFFGDYVRWCCDLPCPDRNILAASVLTTVDQAVYQARRAPAGPVHLNCMFREPLAPVGSDQDFSEYLAQLSRRRTGQAPFTQYPAPAAVAQSDTTEETAALLREARKPLLIVGRMRNKTQANAVRSLGKSLGLLVCADVASGLRLGVDHDITVPFYDLLLLSERFAEHFRPDMILHIGGVPTSKRLLHFLEHLRDAEYVMVADHPLRHDPVHRVRYRIECDVVQFCERLVDNAVGFKSDQTWIQSILSYSTTVEKVLKDHIDKSNELTEPAVARIVSQKIESYTGLFLAGSMPIRDMDMYADPCGPTVMVGCNRGASGIDGTIASAAGFALGLGRPVTLLIGDLAFLHDLNSLNLLQTLRHPLTIILINNNGGGVFSMLPISDVKDVFERCFGTPHGLTFENAAALFGLNYHQPKSRTQFESVFSTAQKGAKSTLIEVRTDREENVRIHRDLEQRIIDAIEAECACDL